MAEKKAGKSKTVTETTIDVGPMDALRMAAKHNEMAFHSGEIHAWDYHGRAIDVLQTSALIEIANVLKAINERGIMKAEH